MNPFKYGIIVSGENFCSRPKTEKQILEYIYSRQNINIQGERRTGKSSLICNTVHKLKGYHLIYIDLLGISSIDDLGKRIIKGFSTYEKKINAFEKVLKSLAMFRPNLSPDPITGGFSISVSPTVKLTPSSLNEIFDIIEIESKKKNIVVILDEFQDILNIKESKACLSILRGKIQFQQNVTYIFAGSVRNQMGNIFQNYTSPFFKSAIPLEIGPMPVQKFGTFLKQKFKTGKREIDDELLQEIFMRTGQIAGDIQEYCSALWTVTSFKQKITSKHLFQALNYIFTMESKGYENIIASVTTQQLNLLRGLALGNGKEITSKVFLASCNNMAASSAIRAVNKLEKIKIIYKLKNEYKFVNPFFAMWLTYKF